MEFFSSNIKRLRTSGKISQKQLADNLEVTRANISAWETGSSFPSLAVMYRLSKYLSVSIDDLLDIDLSDRQIVGQISRKLNHNSNLLVVHKEINEPRPPYSNQPSQLNIPGITYEARTLQVEGDSMSPTLMHGDYVVGEEVSDVRSVRQNSLCIVCMSGRIEVKYVTRYEAGLRLVSESDKNKSELVEWGNIDSVWEVRVRITESIGVVGHPDYLRLVGEVEEVRKSIDNLKNNKDEN